MQEFLTRLFSVINQNRGYGDAIEDEKIVERVLRSLAIKFERVFSIIKASKDLSKLASDDLMGVLKAHEKRSSRFATQNIDQAFDSKVNIGKQKTPKLEQDGGGSIRNQRVRTTF